MSGFFFYSPYTRFCKSFAILQSLSPVERLLTAIALFTSSPDAVSKFVDLDLSNGKRLSVFGIRNQDKSYAICIAPFANQVNSTYAAWIRAKLRQLVRIEYDKAKAIEAVRLPRFCAPARMTLNRIRRANSGGFRSKSPEKSRENFRKVIRSSHHQ